MTWLLLLLLQLPTPERVTFDTDDGVRIAGSYWAPTDRNAPAVVLVHQLGSTRAEWLPLVAALRADRDYAIVAIDLRGHGESTRTQDGHPVDLAHFTEADWHKLPQDVHAAVDYLRHRKDINPRAIGAVGSSIGSSAVLIFAAPNVSVRAVVLLSPGLEYHGLHTRGAMAKYGARPLLMIVAKDDTVSAHAVDALEKVGGRKTRALRVPGQAHGTRMPDINPTIVEFLRQNL